MFEAFIGAGMSAYGSVYEGQEQKQSLLQEADAAERNAVIAQEAGKYNVTRQQNEAYKIIGAAKADYASSGITADSGSVLDVIKESHINAELDRMNIKYGADIESLNQRSRAQALKRSAGNAEEAGYFNAFTSLFGAAASGANTKPTPSIGGSTSGFSGGSGSEVKKYGGSF